MIPSKKQPVPKKSERQSWMWAAGVLGLFVFFLAAKPKQQNVVEQTPAFDPTWGQMQQSLNDVADNYDGEVGIYIKNLKTGDVFEKHADQRFVTASLIKLPIMAAVFKAIQQNKISLDSRIMLRRRHLRDGSGYMKWAQVGQRFRVSDILYQMITRSDNTACAIFIDLLGYDSLNQSFEQFGLNVTRINPTGMSLADHVNAQFDNYTTPREMGMMLEKIYDHQMVSDGASDLMLEIMKHTAAPTRLAKFLPKNWVLARKSGLLRKSCHDCGIVFTPKGDYVICVLTGNNANYKKAKGLIANIGQTAYGYMARS
jgi:beta-lactamase class A